MTYFNVNGERLVTLDESTADVTGQAGGVVNSYTIENQII